MSRSVTLYPAKSLRGNKGRGVCIGSWDQLGRHISLFFVVLHGKKAVFCVKGEVYGEGRAIES